MTKPPGLQKPASLVKHSTKLTKLTTVPQNQQITTKKSQKRARNSEDGDKVAVEQPKMNPKNPASNSGTPSQTQTPTTFNSDMSTDNLNTSIEK